MLSGNILLTGGSGFLGRGILRRAKREDWPAKFIIYSRDEAKQWEVKHRYPEVTCILGDVARDVDRLMAVMAGVDTVLHLGAVKFIPEAEWNVFETIDVNVNGSRNVAIAARAAGVNTVVGISTDKACAPLNAYGVTKSLMERMFGEANRMGNTKFVTVRYGNVIGSTGSVIPLFKQQIAETGKVRITDSNMTRFWLGVDDAVGLIDWSVEEAEKYSGHTFIAACPAMKIVDLAEAVWLEMGMKGDLPIEYTGIRPGEKLHEYLFNEQEAPRVFKLANGYCMMPATQVGDKWPDKHSYVSSQPSRWLTIESMVDLIRDSATV